MQKASQILKMAKIAMKKVRKWVSVCTYAVLLNF